MTIKIIYESKYGSTETIAKWIYEYFSYLGYETMHYNISLDNSKIICKPDDLFIIGSGIYGHDFLPKIKEWFEIKLKELNQGITALFGVAMDKNVYYYNHTFVGGIFQLKPFIEKLNNCVWCEILSGELIFEKLSKNDKEDIIKFYEMIGLKQSDVELRKKPRTLMNKNEVWNFCENILNKLEKEKL